jgi:hypothetical protein
MSYIWIILIFAYAFYLYKHSKSNFFKQPREILAIKRQHLIMVLNDFEVKDIDRWLESYDAFRNYPSFYSYDGATIVRDRDTIFQYDAPAGNHDFGYIHIANLSYLIWLKESFKLDLQYVKDMRTLQVDFITAYSRLIGLIIIKPFYPLTQIKF